MSVRIKARIDHKDGRLETVILPPDIVAWERRTKEKFASGVALGFEDLIFLAWKSLNRSEQVKDTFDKWLEGVEDLDIDENEAAVPFVEGNSEGSTPS